MVLQVKVPAAKPNDLSSIPCLMKERTDSYKFSSDLHMYTHNK